MSAFEYNTLLERCDPSSSPVHRMAFPPHICHDPALRLGIAARPDQGKIEVGQGLTVERKQVPLHIDPLTREARNLLDLFKEGGGAAGIRVVTERLGE